MDEISSWDPLIERERRLRDEAYSVSGLLQKLFSMKVYMQGVLLRVPFLDHFHEWQLSIRKGMEICGRTVGPTAVRTHYNSSKWSRTSYRRSNHPSEYSRLSIFCWWHAIRIVTPTRYLSKICPGHTSSGTILFQLFCLTPAKVSVQVESWITPILVSREYMSALSSLSTSSQFEFGITLFVGKVSDFHCWYYGLTCSPGERNCQDYSRWCSDSKFNRGRPIP